MERTFHMICFSWNDMIHCVNKMQNPAIESTWKLKFRFVCLTSRWANEIGRHGVRFSGYRACRFGATQTRHRPVLPYEIQMQYARFSVNCFYLSFYSFTRSIVFGANGNNGLSEPKWNQIDTMGARATDYSHPKQMVHCFGQTFLIFMADCRFD